MKHKGGTARDRLKEVWSEIASRRTATGYRGRHESDERATDREVHIHQGPWL